MITRDQARIVSGSARRANLLQHLVLKSRSLLEDKLVVFITEFGRSPTPEGDM